MRRVLWIGAGLLTMAAGVVFLAIPGPGTVVLLLGVVLIARESMFVARLLDRAELLLRPGFLRVRRWWQRSSTTQRRVVMALASTLSVLAALASYYMMRR